MKNKTLEITLNEAKEMFAAGGHLADMALSVYSEADINPDYEPEVDEDDNPKYNIETDLPTTWDGAVNILGWLTRAGFMMSSGSGNPTKTEKDWADHVYVPSVFVDDKHIPESYVHLSSLLVVMCSWWKVDNDWEPHFDDNKQEIWTIKIKKNLFNNKELSVEKLDKNKRCLLCFSSEKIAKKFKENFAELIYNCELFIY